MFYPTECKFQTWRAVAVFQDGSECLLYLGRSTTQVRAGYQTAYAQLLEEDERACVRRISLQCWHGVADQGRWRTKDTLAIPGRLSARMPALATATETALAV